MQFHSLDTNPLSPQRIHINRKFASQSRSGIAFFNLPKARIRYRIAGEGDKTIVLCPDPPNTIEHYDGLFELLTPWFTVICYEQPGFGFSEAQAGFTFTFNEYVEVAHDLLTALNRGPYVPAMACVGSYIALALANRHPHLIDKLLIMQGPHWQEEIKWAYRIDSHNIVMKPLVGQLSLFFAKRYVSTKWINYAIGQKSRAPEILQKAIDAINHGGCFCLASFSQGWFIHSAEPAFNTITADSVVIWGMADRSHGPSDKRSVLHYLPNATYLEWNDIGHFPELEDPTRFANVLKDFVLPKVNCETPPEIPQ
jgi:pimeloyl-ACP methyl ester carboxylesterase